MFDLLAYWSLVTAMSIPMFWSLFLGLREAADIFLYEASRQNFKLKKLTKGVETKNSVRMSAIGLLMFILYGLYWIVCDLPDPIYILVSNVARELAPSCGWVAIAAFVMAGLFFLTRSMFDMYYKLMNK